MKSFLFNRQGHNRKIYVKWNQTNPDEIVKTNDHNNKNNKIFDGRISVAHTFFYINGK